MRTYPSGEKDSYTVQQAQEILQKYCAYQERCHFQVQQKLKQLGMIPQAVAHITAHLISHNFLNETRFAESFARGKFTIKKWGRQKITHELKKLQVSSPNTKMGLRQIDFQEYTQTIQELLLKKATGLRLKDFKTQQKCIRFLLSKGFEYELIQQELQNILNAYE